MSHKSISNKIFYVIHYEKEVILDHLKKHSDALHIIKTLNQNKHEQFINIDILFEIYYTIFVVVRWEYISEG